MKTTNAGAVHEMCSDYPHFFRVAALLFPRKVVTLTQVEKNNPFEKERSQMELEAERWRKRKMLQGLEDMAKEEPWKLGYAEVGKSIDYFLNLYLLLNDVFDALFAAADAVLALGHVVAVRVEPALRAQDRVESAVVFVVIARIAPDLGECEPVALATLVRRVVVVISENDWNIAVAMEEQTKFSHISETDR